MSCQGLGLGCHLPGMSAALLEQHSIGSSAEKYLLPRAVVVPAWRVGQKSGWHQGGTLCPLKVLGKVNLFKPIWCPQAMFQDGFAKLKTDSSYF